MNKKFYKIGDFAKLTGVTIKSLRYYDKINILKPAFIDENTGYRYYLPEQAILINIIKLCLMLDLPLKSLPQGTSSTTTSNTTLPLGQSPNLKKIIALGKKKAEEQLQETKNMLNLLNDISEQAERLDEPHKEQEIYFSPFPSRKVLVSPWNMETDKDKDYIEKIAKLTEKAKKSNLNILTQQGLLSDFKLNAAYVFITVEGEYTDYDNINFPQGTYACINLKESDLQNLRKITDGKGFQPYRYAFYINTDIYDFCLDHPLHMMEVQCTNGNSINYPEDDSYSTIITEK